MFRQRDVILTGAGKSGTCVRVPGGPELSPQRETDPDRLAKRVAGNRVDSGTPGGTQQFCFAP